MELTAFLQARIYGGEPHPGLSRLSQLAGHRIGDTTFDRTVAESRQRLEPWMPLFFVPIGEAGGFHMGVHLRPSDVRSRRLAILQVQSPGAIMEISGSLEHLVYWSLAYQEGAGRGRVRPNFPEYLSRAQQVFGEDFYQPGRHGRFSDDEAQQVTASVHGGSADYYFGSQVFESDPGAKLEALKQGMKAEPECMAFYLRAARLHVERGERLQAASMLARALDCYHHTSYEDSLEKDYALAGQLLKEFPGEFSDVNRRDLETTTDKQRLLWVTELYQDGKVELATKILCDMCHDMRDYDSVLHLFRKHFEKLSWDWGLALCEFRAGTIA